MAWFTTDWFSSHHTVRCAHKSGDVIIFIIVACRISSRLKWYKNSKNRLRLAKVIVKNKMSRFLWFSVYNNVCRTAAECAKLAVQHVDIVTLLNLRMTSTYFKFHTEWASFPKLSLICRAFLLKRISDISKDSSVEAINCTILTTSVALATWFLIIFIHQNGNEQFLVT